MDINVRKNTLNLRYYWRLNNIFEILEDGFEKLKNNSTFFFISCQIFLFFVPKKVGSLMVNDFEV